jgi:D-cysteine desulfhydrase
MRTVDMRAAGPAYAIATEEQKSRIAQAARLSGLALDPVYTGKAFSGLEDLIVEEGLRGARVLFVHTGGLPGLLAQSGSFIPHAETTSLA